MSASDPPVVRLVPDGAGYLLKRRSWADGREELLVSWMELTPGPRGGLVPREEWMPRDRVYLLAGVDYSAVEHLRHAMSSAGAERQGAAVPAVPPGWPAHIPPPGAPKWEAEAEAWLLDCLPADFRAHEVVRDPYVLTWMAERHVGYALTALRAGYRGAAVDFKARLAPHVIAEVLDTYRTEGRRLTAAAAAIKVVGAALQRARRR
ncbi:hypothetical protein [Nonomuraea helvata]|uniref:Integrase n=1 Tax=Nonomuraea helvata TaxID=37484 RepID=A0ABV5S7P7_9ACTN